LLAGCVCALLFGLPDLVNGAARLTGLEQPATFHPVSYAQDCNTDSGCAPKTDGYLSGTRDGVSLPGKVPLGRPVPVPAPVWAWGWGRNLLMGIGDAIAALFAGLFLTLIGGAGCAILGVVFLPRPARARPREAPTVPLRPREGG
jgi:hypothetical protein